MPQNVRFVSGSYDPVSQTAAPPVCHASGSQCSISGVQRSHVSDPGSPGAGMV